MNIRYPERHRKWSAIITNWQTSGLSAAAYCRKRDISYANFGYWKRRLVVEQSNPDDFALISFEPQSSDRIGVEVLIGDVRVALEPGFDEQGLCRVVKALRNVTC